MINKNINVMGKNTNSKHNENIQKVSTKPVNVPKKINRNGKNNMRYTKIDKK